MLYDDCAQTPFTAYTDDSRFFCSSLPLQKQVRKSIDSDQLFPLDVPCIHGDCAIQDYRCRYEEPPQEKKKKPTPSKLTSSTPPPIPQKTMIRSKEGFQLPNPDKTTKLLRQDHDKLLPVMNPKFNLREICKQCILLEDHLSHDEKRCFDCCVKHFLTIEALAEEAITLDTADTPSKVRQLPSRVRSLQSKWHEDPDKNAHLVSQELRKIRKDFQIDAFDVVFYSTTCNDGMCKVK